MKTKKQKIILFAFLLAISSGIYAQDSFNSSGGVTNGTGGSVSYSVGQIFYTTSQDESGSVYQGVQQPIEIYIVTDIDNASDIHLSLDVYPNPTTDVLCLDVENENFKSLSYQLYDMSGKIIIQNNIKSTSSRIDVQSIEASTYFLRIVNNETNKEVKTFKIIKTQ